jgi:hypothetical protein
MLARESIEIDAQCWREDEREVKNAERLWNIQEHLFTLK